MADEKDIVARLGERAEYNMATCACVNCMMSPCVNCQGAAIEQEAAAEILSLRAQLSEARGEVAQIVAWLRNVVSVKYCHQDIDAPMIADAIAAGQHKDGSHD